MSARSEDVHIRCTPEQRAQWEAAAARDKRTLTDWIRLRLDDISERENSRARKS